MHTTKINTDQPVSEWYKTLKDLPDNDFVILCDNRDVLTWFMSNFTQFLIKQGESEVAVVYGRHTVDLMSFVYQLNLSLPIAYEIGQKYASNALYDLLLNFETEPSSRFIIWNDADHLYNHNAEEFIGIFESMIVAGYSNRNGLSTLKEDGASYHVDQRNIFVFNRRDLGDLKKLLTKKYDIPSIIKPEEDISIDFNVIELFSNESGNIAML